MFGNEAQIDSSDDDAISPPTVTVSENTVDTTTLQAGMQGLSTSPSVKRKKKKLTEEEKEARRLRKEKRRSKLPTNSTLNNDPGDPDNDPTSSLPSSSIVTTDPQNVPQDASTLDETETTSAPKSKTKKHKRSKPKDKPATAAPVPNAHDLNTGVFMITFNGQIETADFQFHDNLYCTFGFSYGTDWQVIAGIQEGMTQVTRKASSSSDLFTWNFPIDVTFKSTNPFGWPRIYLQVYGLDTFGREVVRGYGSTNLPLTAGRHALDVSMFVPLPSSFLKTLSGYFLGNRAEFIDPKFVTSGIGREVTRVQSQGSVQLSVSVVSKDFARYGYSR
eukprot:m.89457 g.89457  ORF g.89457 m.89457 type:complete len:332 (-) comp26298_c0_seq1:103-1098(-)